MEEIIFERMGGVDAGHGHKFEWEMTTLAYLRCQRLHEQWKKDNKNGIKSFSVANNVKGAGIFDDIVIRVEYVVDSIVKIKVIFVQCKHIEDPSKNSKKRFQTLLAERKPQRDLLESFVNIEQLKEQLQKDGSSGKPINTKQNIRPQQDGDINNLRSFFGCKNVDTEFVFCSNIEIEPDFESSIYKVGTEINSKDDISNILFNTSNNSLFELRLKVSKDAKSSMGSVTEQNSIGKHFHEKFRVFVNQPEPETLIYKELQSLKKSNLDTKYLQTLTTEELRSHFTSNNPCTALTEKSNTVATVVNFMRIRMKSIAIMKDFCDNFGVQNIFSLETTLEFQKQLEQNRIFNIKTNLQQLETIKVKQVFNSLPFECTCIFLNDEIDTEEWIAARETSNYSNLKMVYICSQANVNFDEFTIKPYEVFCQISRCNEQQSTLSEYLHQFSEETKNFILNVKLLSQGVKLDIKSFCGNSWKYFFDENTICEILQNKLIELYEPLPDLDFYIERHFQRETLDLEQMKKKMLEWKSVNNGIILFSENDNCVPGSQASYKLFENIQDVRTFVKQFLTDPQDTFHLCLFSDNEPKLIYSLGKSSALTVKSTMTQDSLLHDKQTRIKIISDVAGMGKSTTLLALAELVKASNPSYLVFFIELNKYLNRLKHVKDLSSTDAAIIFLGKDILNLKEVELRVFINACNESGKVALYFDAFDEISPDAEKAFLSLLLTLERTKICRIYVSSRPNYVHVLENTILQKSMQFLGLTDAEKECALEGFWKQLLIKYEMKVDESVLKETAQTIVHLLQKEGHLLIDILAIPLQIRMLATIYYETLEEGQIPELSTVNLCDLYEEFINLHVKRFYVDKHKMQWNTMKVESKRRLIMEKLRGAEEVACQTVIPELLEYNETKMCNVILTLCEDLGLITDKNPPVFLHRTIAEYLAAKYVVTKLNDLNEGDTLCSILTADRFNVVRRFINSLLVGNSAEKFFKKERYQWNSNIHKNNPLHVASLEENVEIMSFLLRCDQSLLNEKNIAGKTAIYTACENSKQEAVKLLLTYNDCSVNKREHLENTPLHAATKTGNTEIMEILLRRDKSLLNKQNNRGEALLHLACEKKNGAAAKFLLENTDCLVNLCDRGGNTVLHSAARNCSPEIIGMILRRDTSLLNKKNFLGELPLHHACVTQHEAAAKFLLENPDCLVNLCDSGGNTVLHIAARQCSPEVIEMILLRDTSLLNKQNDRGEAPLHFACEEENEAAVKFLLENPDCFVNLCDSDGNTVLHRAAASLSPEIIELILRRDKSLLNKKNISGKAPLHIAFENQSTKVLNYLLSHQECVIDICDTAGNTLLHMNYIFFSKRNYCDEMKIIVQHKSALINKQNDDGETPLHRMIRSSRYTEANLLLSHTDCSVNICDKSNQTALHDAVLYENIKLVKIILQRESVLINQQNDEGQTPLHLAAYKQFPEAVNLLIAYPGCSINMRDKIGFTALDIALDDEQKEIIDMLLQEYGNITVEEDSTHSAQSVTTDDGI